MPQIRELARSLRQTQVHQVRLRHLDSLHEACVLLFSEMTAVKVQWDEFERFLELFRDALEREKGNSISL